MQSTQPDTKHINKSVYSTLLHTDLFQVYRNAFENVTGQTLALIHPDIPATPSAEASRCKNRFCSIMLNTDICKHRCTDNVIELAKHSGSQAFTDSCDANITTTLIPIKADSKIVAYLRSGQVRTDHSNLNDNFLLNIKKHLPVQTAKNIEKLYSSNTVYSKKDYNSQITLLGAFALQLSDLAKSITTNKIDQPGGMIESTKKLIHQKLTEKITLDQLSENVNVTTSYLCKQFKKATGLTAIEYINRHRIERAKALLSNKNTRIIEIAYETGFQSLSQFNRSFQRYAGLSPTEYKSKHHQQTA